jgi:hypothetical protein
MIKSGLQPLHNWLAQFVPAAASVAAVKDTMVAPPHTIARNKMNSFTWFSCWFRDFAWLKAAQRPYRYNVQAVFNSKALFEPPPTEAAYAL